ncbi:hypothetical protein MRX96_012995 [Rhipicephalus microplus]
MYTVVTISIVARHSLATNQEEPRHLACQRLHPRLDVLPQKESQNVSRVGLVQKQPLRPLARPQLTDPARRLLNCPAATWDRREGL